jgi:putative uncharacterized protein YCR013C
MTSFFVSLTIGSISSIKLIASFGSIFIFQFPAIIFLLIFISCYYLFAIHSIPGNVFPSINSNDAPPPVEMCVILSAKPAFVTAAPESPPPIIVIASFRLANLLAIAFVPIAN